MMKPWLTWALLGMVVVTAFPGPSPARAQQGTHKGVLITPHGNDGNPDEKLGRTVALIVGVNQYKNAAIPKLQFAVKDAEAIRDRFLAKIPTVQPVVTLLTDEAASRERIIAGVNEIIATAQKDDTVLIYFSLHGLADRTGRDDGYLVAWDADIDNIQTTGVSVQDLQRRIGRIQARRVFVLLDACFSGTAVTSWAAGARSFNVGPTTRSVLSNTVFDQIKSQRGRFVLSASRPSETAMEFAQLGSGLFTYFLIKGAEGEAAVRGNPFVTVGDLYSYVSMNVVRFARGLGQTQTPQMFGEFDGAPPILTTFDLANYRPEKENLATLIEDAKRSMKSSRLLIKSSGNDKIEIFVAGNLQRSSSESRIEYIVKKEDFDRWGKEVEVKVMAVPASGDRRADEQKIVLVQGEQREIEARSVERPRTGAAPPPRQSRVPPPMF